LESSARCLCDSPRSPANRRRRRFRHQSLAASRSVTRRLSDSPPRSVRHLDHVFDEDLAASDAASSTVTATFPGDPLSLEVRSTAPGELARPPDQSETLATSTISSGLVSCGTVSSTQPTTSAVPAIDRCSGSADATASPLSVGRGLRGGRRYLGSTRAVRDPPIHRRPRRITQTACTRLQELSRRRCLDRICTETVSTRRIRSLLVSTAVTHFFYVGADTLKTKRIPRRTTPRAFQTTRVGCNSCSNG